MVDHVTANPSTVSGGPQFATRLIAGINFPLGLITWGSAGNEVDVNNPFPVVVKPNASLVTPGHIAAGGVVQFVTGILGAPPNWYELQNCDPNTYMFSSETTSVWINGPPIPGLTGQFFPGGDGWNVAPLLGGGYVTSSSYQPNQARGVAIYSPLTNHRFVWKSS